jgi:hypothetical protein
LEQSDADRDFDETQLRATIGVQPKREYAMKLKTAFAALALTLAPMMVSAACSSSHQAMSCAEGMVWDSATSSCTKQVSS